MHTLLLAALLVTATGGKPIASLDATPAWINTPPLTAATLRGKVVLVQFWTYSCINWRRTVPAVRAWESAYREAGLVVIGVHAPEFPFERVRDNVAEAARAIGIDYPIAIDNDFAIWRAFDNDAWPALYLIDANGRVRYRHAGEGDEQSTEDAIRRLLRERGSLDRARERGAVAGRGVEAAADWANLRSPETYLGVDRAVNFDSPGGISPDASRRYAFPKRFGLNHWALSGDWTVTGTAAESNGPHGTIAYRFHARDVHLVMGNAARGRVVRFRVRIDGREPGAAHGSDVDAHGYGTLREPRLYQLIRQRGRIVDRQVEIEFVNAGAQAYAFTFG